MKKSIKVRITITLLLSVLMILGAGFLNGGALFTVSAEDVQIIYVSMYGSDENAGTKDSPLASLGKALELEAACSDPCEILIKEGTYTGSGYHVSSSVKIKGEENVVLEYSGSEPMFTTESSDAVANLELSNLTITTPDGVTEAEGAIETKAANLTLDHVTFDGYQSSKYIISCFGSITLKDSAVTDCSAARVISSTSDIAFNISNTTFSNNTVTSFLIYLGSASSGINRKLTVSGSSFIENTTQNGVISTRNASEVSISDSLFADNSTYYQSTVVTKKGELTITNSSFYGNKASNGYSGALMVESGMIATVTGSRFIDNECNISNNTSCDSIRNEGQLSISYSIIKARPGHLAIYNSDASTLDAPNNWWGSNDPCCMHESQQGDGQLLVGQKGTINVPKWVILNTELSTEEAAIGETVIISADLNHVDTAEGEVEELTGGSIPYPDGLEFKFMTPDGSWEQSEQFNDGNVARANYIVDGENNELVTCFDGAEKRDEFTIISRDPEIITKMDIGNVWTQLSPTNGIAFTTAFDPDGELDSKMEFVDQFWTDTDTEDPEEIHVGESKLPVVGHTYAFSVIIAPKTGYAFDNEKFDEFIYGGSAVAKDDYNKVLLPWGGILLQWGVTAKSKPDDLNDAVFETAVSGIVSKTYTGKALTQPVTVKIKEHGAWKTLKSGSDYTLSYENNTNAGTASVIISGKGNFTGNVSRTFRINQAANPLKISPKTATVKYSKLKKKTQTLAVTKVIKFTKKLSDKKTYTLVSAKKGSKSFKKYFKINKTTGKVTVKKNKKMKKGTYKVMVKVKALGNSNYKASAVKAVTFTVKVK